MAVRLDPPALPEWEQPFAAVQDQSQQLGLRAYVVGGYVRDRLLGGERGKTIREVDILVDGKGATQLATAVGRAIKLRPPVIFERFGTAHLDLDHRALESVTSSPSCSFPSRSSAASSCSTPPGCCLESCRSWRRVKGCSRAAGTATTSSGTHC